MDRFKAGRIAKIKVKGFMTYDELEIFPNKGLNMIIGLNGSGKSSIMSAICLGLAGKPQFTGKSAQPQDFIKHNHTKATIEIELEDVRGKNVRITRTIQGEKSTYLLNGSPSSQADVMSVVRKFNIDVGNLCQFLPQEKVVEFSKMDRKQRLENMLQAIGEPQLYTTFDQLKQMRLECNDLEHQLSNLNNEKASEEQINSRLKTEVEKHEERKRLVDELGNMKLFRTMMLYSQAKKNVEDFKKEKHELNGKKRKVEQEMGALETGIVRAASERKECIDKMRLKQSRVQALSDKLAKSANDLTDLHEKVQLAKIDFRNMITEKQNQKAKLAEMQKQITGLQIQYEQFEGEEENMSTLGRENYDQFEKIKNELSTLDHDIAQINVDFQYNEGSQRSLKSRIDKMKNEQDKKMEFLKQRFRPTYEAVTWLRQNIGTFKSTICEPAILSIKVTDENSSKFIENIISIRDLLAFVCQDKDDVKRLTTILREEKKLAINVALAPDTASAYYNTPQITKQLQQLGVKCYVKDLFNAPELVMRYLCQIYKIHTIPICNNYAERNVNVILQRCKVFFTENERYSGTRSKYGAKNLSVKRDQFRGKGFLVSSKDQSDLLEQNETQLRNCQQMYNKLREQLEELKKNRIVVERRQEQNRAEKRELQEKLQRMKSIREQLQLKTRSYQSKEAEIIDEKVEKAKEAKRINRLNQEKMILLLDIGSVLKDYHALKLEKAKQIPLSKVLCQKVKDLTDKKQESRTQFEEMEESFQNICQEYRRWKETALKYLDELRKHDTEFLKDTFKHVLSLEDVEQKIVNLQAQLELNCEENNEAVQEYEERQRVITNALKSIKEMDEEISKLKNSITAKKLPWLEKLETHIQNINAKFTQYYKILKCAGEISLYQSEDPDDFLKYGLQIRLKYRAEEDFIELSQTRHSGGECSVAAIIFILSLQELTNVPFRCIDEINQGMDAVNERKIYQLIADASMSGTSCSQYFLLTPKLLMDLAYHENVKVHIIFNSLFLKMRYNLKKHLISAAATAN